jgi:hypothetical protein
MRVLFDQATPLPIRAYLDQHSVSTASQQGWDKLKNGDLLTAAENAGFEVFLTTDQEHSLSTRPHAPKNCNSGSRAPTVAATTRPRADHRRSGQQGNPWRLY